jgi:plastocyanin
MVLQMRWIGVLLATGALAIAGCGGGDDNGGSSSGSSSSGSSSSSSSSSGGGGTLALAADPNGGLSFDKKTLTAKAGSVTINFTNDSSTPHAVAVEGNGVDKDGKTVTKGKDSLTVDLKPGKYEFYCPVDGHKAAGMEGTLTVN